MKILKSGEYICKIVYNPKDERYVDPLEDLLNQQPYIICKVYTRKKNRIWFYDVKICDDTILKKFKLKKTENNLDTYYNPFCGFIYEYDGQIDMYICYNQILKNTGGMVWNLYIKIYCEVE